MYQQQQCETEGISIIYTRIPLLNRHAEVSPPWYIDVLNIAP